MAAAIKKYGWSSFTSEILFTGLTREEAEAQEIALIAAHKSNDRRYGYNTEAGGSSGGRMSEESRKKLSERMRGDANPTRRLGHPFVGRNHTEESKRKMSEAAKARTGRFVTEETKKKLRDSQKKQPVRNLDTGIVYPGIHEAAERTGLSATRICAVCRGRRKSTGGHRWEYVK